jgi:putative glutamine amidotransferase
MASMAQHGEAPKGDPVDHPVRVAQGTALAETCGTTLDACNSQHHQGIDRLGDGLVAVGWSDDGLIEAVEADGEHRGWMIGVQWHPERTAAADPSQQALFDALAEKARSRTL